MGKTELVSQKDVFYNSIVMVYEKAIQYTSCVLMNVQVSKCDKRKAGQKTERECKCGNGII